MKVYVPHTMSLCFVHVARQEFQVRSAHVCQTAANDTTWTDMTNPCHRAKLSAKITVQLPMLYVAHIIIFIVIIIYYY